MPIKIYRIKEVCQITGLCPSSVYKQIRLNQFPAGIKLTSRSTGWASDSIDAWITARIQGNTNG
jgi:predicted DNA-binding transcriptional regulator AlpA